MTPANPNGDTECGQMGLEEWYAGRVVLVTGASGFVGKVLVEALLRKTKVRKLYILLRAKKGKAAVERLGDLQQSSVFDLLRNTDRKDRLAAMKVVTGDVSLPLLGLNQQDRLELLENVDTVFHCAATVKFNDNLKTAIQTNIYGNAELMRLARSMPRLKAVVYVSTAYVNSHLRVPIEEKVLPLNRNIDLIKMADALNDDAAQHFTDYIIGESYNTYVFTKRAAEDMILKEFSDLPVAIVRPSIVSCTLKEPLVGWTDNLNGPTGLCIGMNSGFVRVLMVDPSKVPNIVPVDYVANTIIAAARDVARDRNECSESKDRLQSPAKVYNAVNSTPITWGRFINTSISSSRKEAYTKSVWYPFVFMAQTRIFYNFLVFLFHILPATYSDLLLKMQGKPPQCLKNYRKVKILMKVLIPFTLNDWKFKTDNMDKLWKSMNSRDREIFPLTTQPIDWTPYIKSFLQGVKQFILKDDISESDAKRKALRYWSSASTNDDPSFISAHRLRVCHWLVVLLVISCLVLPCILIFFYLLPFNIF